MNKKKPVIVLTDGDETAYQALTEACHDLHCHAVRASKGNPTPLRGKSLIQAILNTPGDPVVVMVDDRGEADLGVGEEALQDIMDSGQLDVLGVVAVASNTPHVEGVRVDGSVTREGRLIEQAVDKSGLSVSNAVLRGDTVDVLAEYTDVPVVGLGDPGKMDGHDSVSKGVPATRRALEEILKRSGWDVSSV